MLKTPGGMPAFSASSARIMAAPGSRSEGLRIRQLPVAVAIGIDQRGIIAGKSNQLSDGIQQKVTIDLLKGAIAATIPNGSR